MTLGKANSFLRPHRCYQLRCASMIHSLTYLSTSLLMWATPVPNGYELVVVTLVGVLTGCLLLVSRRAATTSLCLLYRTFVSTLRMVPFVRKIKHLSLTVLVTLSVA